MRRRRGWAALAMAALVVFLLLPLGRGQQPRSLGDLEAIEPQTLDDAAPVTLSAQALTAARTVHVAMDDGSIVKMDLEDYIYGVLAAEMPASFEPEALKAQAVAARTFALRKQMTGGCSRNPGADVCTDSGHCTSLRSGSKRSSVRPTVSRTLSERRASNICTPSTRTPLVLRRSRSR